MAGIKVRYNAPFTLTFAIIAAGVFLITQTTDIFTDFVMVHGSFNFNSLSAYVGLALHPLGHANWAHLLGNMAFILLLGPVLENKYGTRNLALMCLVTAAATGILHTIIFPENLLGASGIVFMFIILVSFANAKAGEIPLTFILVVLIFIGQEIVKSFDSDNISQFGHIMGGVFGAIFGFIIPGRKKKKEVQEPLPDALGGFGPGQDIP